jgi:hypothetical protein
MLPSALCQGVGVLKLGIFRCPITRPVVLPVASYPVLRPCPQESEPAWLARPSPYDSFIRCISPDSMPTALPTPPVVVLQARCLRHRVDATTRYPHLGSCGDTGRGKRVYVRKLVERQRLRLFPRPLMFPFGNGRTDAGGHGVNTLIRRGLRENAKSGPLTPRLRHPVYVRLCSGSVRWSLESRSATLAANSNQGARWNTTKTEWTRWCWRCSP